MKKFLVGMMLLAGAIAVIAVIVKRRSGSDVDEWDSLAGDTYSRASQSVSKATNATTESVSEAAERAQNP
jgi:uncharacterized protein (UPF0333 family)